MWIWVRQSRRKEGGIILGDKLMRIWVAVRRWEVEVKRLEERGKRVGGENDSRRGATGEEKVRRKNKRTN